MAFVAAPHEREQPRCAGLSQSRRPDSNRGPLHYERDQSLSTEKVPAIWRSLCSAGGGQICHLRDVWRDLGGRRPALTHAVGTLCHRPLVESERSCCHADLQHITGPEEVACGCSASADYA